MERAELIAGRAHLTREPIDNGPAAPSEQKPLARPNARLRASLRSFPPPLAEIARNAWGVDAPRSEGASNAPRVVPTRALIPTGDS